MSGVRIDAFATSDKALDLGCLRSDGILAQATTSDKGEFKLQIAPDHANFVTRYCADGFATRIEPTNDNEPDAPLRPAPVSLVKRLATREDLRNILRQFSAVTRKKYGQLESRYGAEVMAAVLRNLPPDEERLLKGIGRGPLVRPHVEIERRVLNDAGQLTSDLIGDFDYLFASVPEALCAAADEREPFADYVLWRCKSLRRKE